MLHPRALGCSQSLPMLVIGDRVPLMKISSTSSLGGAKSVGKSGKARAKDGQKFSIDEETSVEPAASTAGAAPMGAIASIDALLAIQEADSADTATEGRSKGLQRGHDLLDMLEGLRRAILLGVVSIADLRQLADTARNRRGATGDSTLDAVLEEIELRAEVELAKYGY